MLRAGLSWLSRDHKLLANQLTARSGTLPDLGGVQENMPRLYLLDIEGTTSPMAFVYEALFPYARTRLAGYLANHSAEPELLADLESLAGENVRDLADGAPAIVGVAPTLPIDPETLRSCNAYLLWLMDRDRKSTALKSLQGKVWASGYKAGELQGEVFPDVAPALERWHRTARVAIYSSGSVEAQKDLFKHTGFGDLTPLISAYFDTRTGPKTDPGSYQRIADAMCIAAAESVFVSDSPRELDAARQAGMKTVLSIRPGNSPVESVQSHPVIRTFADLS